MKIGYTDIIPEAPPEELVCWCSTVSTERILQAIRDGADCIER